MEITMAHINPLDPQSLAYTATLVDGSTIDHAYLTRCTGYDASVWVSNGVSAAPITSIVRLDIMGGGQ